MTIEQFINSLLSPYSKMQKQAVKNFFKDFNEENSTEFNCIFFEGRAYSSAEMGDPHKYITSEFAEKVESFRPVFNMEEEAFHIQRKLNKYLVKLDRTESFMNCIPKDWMLNEPYNPEYPEMYKEILGKDADDFEKIIQKCIIMRIMA